MLATSYYSQNLIFPNNYRKPSTELSWSTLIMANDNRLQSVLVAKDELIADLRIELARKNDAIKRAEGEKKELETKMLETKVDALETRIARLNSLLLYK